MKRFLTALAVALVAIGLSTTAAQNSAHTDKLFAAAEHQATVEGNLKAAIEIYRQVVDQAGSNRALAARALLRMGDAYQKLGDAAAPTVYERLAREFPDQTEIVALARIRFTGSVPAAENPQQAAVWAPEGVVFGTASADGRYLSYTDVATGSVKIRDFVAKTDNIVVEGSDTGQAEYSALSNDGRSVAYAWRTEGAYQLRSLTFGGTGSPQIPHVVIDDIADRDLDYLTPNCWLADGRHIVASVTKRDSTGVMVVIAIEDGRTQSRKASWGEAGGQMLNRRTAETEVSICRLWKLEIPPYVDSRSNPRPRQTAFTRSR